MYCIFLDKAQSVELCGVDNDAFSLLVDGTYFYVTSEDVIYLRNCNFGELINKTLSHYNGYDKRNVVVS